MISISLNKTVQDLFSLYARRVGINEKLLGTEIIFIFNAKTLERDDKRLISEVFKTDSYVITVVDQNNVIGAAKN